MINSLRASGKCAVLVSEENEDPIIIHVVQLAARLGWCLLELEGVTYRLSKLALRTLVAIIIFSRRHSLERLCLT
jgi:hypothetical protein